MSWSNPEYPALRLECLKLALRFGEQPAKTVEISAALAEFVIHGRPSGQPESSAPSPPPGRPSE